MNIIIYILLFTGFVFSDVIYNVNGVNNPPTSYATIQAALNATPSNLVMDNNGRHIIELDSGIYAECLSITRTTDSTRHLVLRPKAGQERKTNGDFAVEIRNNSCAGSNGLLRMTAGITISDIYFNWNTSTVASVIRFDAGYSKIERVKLRTEANVNCIYSGEQRIDIFNFICASVFSGTGSYNGIYLEGNNSRIANVLIDMDADNNGVRGLNVGISTGSNNTISVRNSVVIGGTSNNFSGIGSNSLNRSNASMDASAPGLDSIRSFSMSNTNFIDTLNLNYNITTSSIFHDAGTDLSSIFTKDISTATIVNWPIGPYDPTHIKAESLNQLNLDIKKPVSHTVKQRKLDGTSINLSVSGIYQDTTVNFDSIVCSYRSVNYKATVDTTNDSFYVTIPATKGTGNLICKTVPDKIYTDTSGAVNYGYQYKIDTSYSVAVGDLYMLGGESDFVGHARDTINYSGSTQISKINFERNWHTLDEPLSSFFTATVSVIPATMSILDSLVDSLPPIGFIAVGHDNSLITRYFNSTTFWMPMDTVGKGPLGQIHWNNMKNLLDTSGIDDIRGMWFYGGEWEASYGMKSKKSYYDTLLMSIDSMTHYFDPINKDMKFMFGQIGHFPNLIADSALTWPFIDSIRLAQNDCFKNKASCYPVFNRNDINILDAKYPADSVHIKDSTQIITSSHRWARMAGCNFYGTSECRGPLVSNMKLLGLDTIEITYTLSTNKIRPSSLDTAKANKSFHIYDVTGRKRAKSFIRSGNNKLKIVMDSVFLGDTITVSFGLRNDQVDLDFTDSSSINPLFNLPPEMFANRKIYANPQSMFKLRRKRNHHGR